ncbi:flagellar brake protein [Ureibacillus thermophilus]|mgnify:FL=1|uniref:flagellar brake protein n=1 Tax=Ureibacillus thermophilus TaxID=367743 RepID=UPI0036210A58
MEIKIGMFITLEPISSENVEPERVKCKVLDVKDDHIYVTQPVKLETNEKHPLEKGSDYRVVYQGEDKVIYTFQTKVLGVKKGFHTSFKLSYPPKKEIKKIERRKFVRVRTAVDVSIEYKNQFYPYATKDISAGGMAIKLDSPPPFAEEDLVKLVIVLPFKNGEIQYVKTDAKVVRIFKNNDEDVASFQFLNIDENDQQLILRFCFERQVLMMKEMSNLQ